MKEIIIEMEVDEPSQVMELPVNEENIIELDFTYLDDELEDSDLDLDGNNASVTNPSTDQNPDHEEEEEEEDQEDMEENDFEDDMESDLDI
ncbi:hypothetical protein L0P88_05315 [Muricauda sp. SCSIO 64092]|uniref:hypothetical protein n=1 Tax=Allomuricauda sp. SCSIO 64092 TaxID=2908842 RepID=UPI001FF1A1BF|nr:hypothetical protein [Muricauda sp. SCSIO 64092]UOY07970.1 hypothetical protein L0P88_05315 [Muricauda sp. SCSIO 64092]